jgi:hypothetical protein
VAGWDHIDAAEMYVLFECASWMCHVLFLLLFCVVQGAWLYGCKCVQLYLCLCVCVCVHLLAVFKLWPLWFICRDFWAS